MMILTNSRKTYGACCILYPKVLEQLAERVDGDYYLIPSSVHEFILLPERDQGRGAKELKKDDRRSEQHGADAGRIFVGSFLFIQQPESAVRIKYFNFEKTK